MDLFSAGSFTLPPQLAGEANVHRAMAAVAHFNSAPQFNLLQETLRHLSQKAEYNTGFSDEEREFVRAVLASPWWGGMEYGFNESIAFLDEALESGSQEANAECRRRQSMSAQLQNVVDSKQMLVAQFARHFLQGDGQLFAANVQVFKSSLLVKDVTTAMKKFIAEKRKAHKPITMISSADTDFLKSRYAQEVAGGRADTEILGQLFYDGSMLLEQKDTRLRNEANRFVLVATNTSMGSRVNTQWRVDGEFDFKIFNNASGCLSLPLNPKMVLQVSTHLPHALVDSGHARPFKYFANWSETWGG